MISISLVISVLLPSIYYMSHYIDTINLMSRNRILDGETMVNLWYRYHELLGVSSSSAYDLVHDIDIMNLMVSIP